MIKKILTYGALKKAKEKNQLCKDYYYHQIPKNILEFKQIIVILLLPYFFVKIQKA